MKRFITLVLLLSGLGSCSMQDDYYREPPGTTAYVTKPYGHYFNNYQDRMSDPQNYPSRNQTGVVITRPGHQYAYENGPSVQQRDSSYYNSRQHHGYHYNNHPHDHD